MGPRILGIAASLRNARWGAGSEALVADLTRCADEAALRAYLKAEGALHLQQFVDAGRAEGLPFDEIRARLRRLSGARGLSNSEVALAAGLWAASRAGATIEHLSLTEHFPPLGPPRKLDRLAARLRAADGLLLSGPVYFGDRGSLAQELVDLIRSDAALRAELDGTVYGGIAVGAKRNGGQETTLIYQLLDMVQAGLLGVGNDSDTTSQYGGTAHAGDVGTMPADDYGLDTSMGVGRRVAHAAALVRAGRAAALRGPVRLMIWILQDRDQLARRRVERLLVASPEVEATVVDLTEETISRCIACDICPTHIAVDELYRCIITGKRDGLAALHPHLLHHDALVPVVFSPTERSGLRSAYQRFIERTRYLRRGDYALGDTLMAPLVVEEVGTHDQMALRATTSLIRHHTIVSAPRVTHLHGGRALDEPGEQAWWERLLRQVRVVAAGRLAAYGSGEEWGHTRYHPVGYVLSTERDREDDRLRMRGETTSRRHARLAEEARTRLGPGPAEADESDC